MVRIAGTIALLAATWTLSTGMAATPLPVDVAVGLKNLGSTPTVSSDQALLAFVVNNPRNVGAFVLDRISLQVVPSRNIGGEIWIKDLKGGELQKLQAKGSSAWGPVWSPDGRALAFVSDRDGDVRIWIWDRATKRVARASEAIVRVDASYGDSVQWLPNSREIFAMFLPALDTRGDASEQPPRLGDPNQVTVKVSSSRTVPPPIDSQNPRTIDLGILDVASGTVRRFALRIPVLNCGLSPVGELLACNVRDVVSSPSPTTVLSVFAVDVGTRLLSVPTHTNRRTAFSWAPDGTHLLFEVNKKPAVYLVDTRRIPLRPAELRWPEGAAVRTARWNAGGQALFALAGRVVWRVPLDETQAAKKVDLPPDTYGGIIPDGQGLAWQPVGEDSVVLMSHDQKAQERSAYFTANLSTGETKVLFRAAAGHSLQETMGLRGQSTLIFSSSAGGFNTELWRLDATSMRAKPTPLVIIDPEYSRQTMGRFQLIEWQTVEGRTLTGSLLLPVGYKPGRRYPVMVWVYGGDERILAEGGYRGGGPFDFQVLATRGYAVLQPSTPLRVGSPLKDLAAAVLPAVDKVVEMGIADPQRLAVMGNSYGGYSVKALLVQTTRFRAAITSVGSGGNLFTTYAGLFNQDRDSLAALESGQLGMGGDPWRYRERYIENSPFFFYDKIRTPLLIQAGLSDSHLNVLENNETFVALRRLGVDVEYLRYEGEGHAMLGFANQVDFWNRRLAFLAKHLDLVLDEHGAITFDGASARSRKTTEEQQ